MLQVTCSCGNTPAEGQLAASFLLILQQPPAELGTSNCHVCLADSLQVLDDRQQQRMSFALTHKGLQATANSAMLCLQIKSGQ